MSSAAKPRKARPTKQRLLTVADVAALPDELPSGPVRYELDNGRLVIMPPAGFDHGHYELRLGSALLIQGETRGFGKACCGETGILLWTNPDRLVGADAAFIMNRSLPLHFTKERYLATIPELVVEVVSLRDSISMALSKIKDYLKAGVQVIWLVKEKTRTVVEYRPGQEPREYKESDTLTVEDIIPGFQFPVSSVFAE